MKRSKSQPTNLSALILQPEMIKNVTSVASGLTLRSVCSEKSITSGTSTPTVSADTSSRDILYSA